MNISRTADHALRAVLHLAQEDPDAWIPAHRIADALGAPSNYLAKTLGSLARAGVVEGMRGAVGGFRLARPADRLAVAEVLDAVDAPEDRRVCLLGDRLCERGDPCGAHVLWTTLQRRAQEPFRSTTVAELLAGSRA